MQYFLTIDGAIDFSQLGAEPEYMVEKGALSPLIGFEFAVFVVLFLGLVKKIVPYQGAYDKANQPAKWNAEQVEQKNTGKTGKKLALNFQGVM